MAKIKVKVKEKTVLDEYIESHVQTFEGEYDEEGVYFYQAFKDSIADYAIENQRFGGDDFNATRMTWIKPSFAWVLYRAGYGLKHNQKRILKIKISHEAVDYILSNCKCVEAKWSGNSDESCGDGRIQWDPARDLYMAEKKEPRKILTKRAIQIGLARSLSEYYVNSIISIEDVTELANNVGRAHLVKNSAKTAQMLSELDLPDERVYMPTCRQEVLQRIGLVQGEGARCLAKVGKGKGI